MKCVLLKLGDAKALGLAARGVEVLELVEDGALLGARDEDLGVDTPVLFFKTIINFTKSTIGVTKLFPLIKIKRIVKY